MNCDFSVGIVSHRDRRPMMKRLARRMRADVVSEDDGRMGCTTNHIVTLDRLHDETGAGWCVVLEDDAVPVRDARRHIQKALCSAPTSIVSFYLGTSYPQFWQPGVERAIADAEEADVQWIVGEHLLHAVGYAVRRHTIPDLTDFLGHNRTLPIDEAITQWARPRARAVGYTVPSLVNHADGVTVESHRDGIRRTNPRVAHRFGVPRTWSRESVPLEYI